MQLFPVRNVWSRCFALGVFFVAIGGCCLQVPAAQPEDNCSGAIEIPAGVAFPYKTRLVAVADATTFGDPPYPTEVFGIVTRSVWFTFTPSEAAATNLFTISTAFDTDTNFRDSTMAIYTSSNGSCTGATNLYEFNDDQGSLRASISTVLTNGTTYYIVVWVGELSDESLVYDLMLHISKPSVPANDTCQTAFELPSLISAPYQLPVAIDTTLATTTAGVTPPCVTNIGSFPSRDVWFKFTPAVSGTYIFSTSSEVGTLIDDTSLGLYTNDCSFLSQIACNDNGLGRGVLFQALSAGGTYYLAVWDNAPNFIPGETRLQLQVSQATQPTVETRSPISIASTGAVLSGTVNVNALLGRFWFEWGPTSSLGSTSQVKVLFANATTFTTNLPVTGFSPNTVYQYRMVSTNAQGKSVGAIQTFVWSNSPPTLTSPNFPEISAGRAFEFSFTGNTNQVYVIQSSTNLINWTDLGAATNQETSWFSFRHSLPPLSPQLYYQIRLP